MDNTGIQLLSCLRAYCRGTSAEQIGGLDWQEFYHLAGIHKLVPVVYDTLSRTEGFCGGDAALAGQWKRSALMQAAGQALRTQRMLAVARELNEACIPYVLVKGVLCRQLYPKPDLRPSGDEDLLIPVQARARCREIFAGMGLVGEPENEGAVEHWQDPASGLHIELHTALFENDWPAGSVLNAYFANALERRICVPVEQGSVMTFAPTDHFLFLIGHALKHFITGGFGLRTLCDILMFARTYSEEICRETVYDQLERIRGRVFFEQLLYIGSAHLDFDPAGWELRSPEDWEALLEDMTDAGVYGQSSLDRKHGGAMALQAVREESAGNSVVSALFPSAKRLSGRYPWLKKAPWALPAAWIHRMGSYGMSVLRSRGNDNSPREALSSGKQRTEMMKRYGILSQAKTEDR